MRLIFGHAVPFKLWLPSLSGLPSSQVPRPAITRSLVLSVVWGPRYAGAQVASPPRPEELTMVLIEIASPDATSQGHARLGRKAPWLHRAANKF